MSARAAQIAESKRVAAAASSTSWVVRTARLAHGAIAAFFIGCILVVYMGAWLGQAERATWVAVVALSCEGVLVLASGGDCPLTPVFRRLGDTTPLFELILPALAAKRAVPVLGAVTAGGFVLLGLRIA